MRRVIAFVLVWLMLGIGLALADQPVAPQPKVANLVEVIVAPGAETDQAVATVRFANKAPARIVSIPLEFKAEGKQVWLDSVSFAGTRVEHFKLKDHTFFPERNAVLLLMSAPRTSEGYQDLEPSAGSVAKLYLGSKGDFPLKTLTLRTVDLPPGNKLMYVTDGYRGETPEFTYRLAEGDETTTSMTDEK